MYDTYKFQPHLTTEQAIFDHVCEHLANQKKRAMQDKPAPNRSILMCSYYKEDTGHACAIGGCLLPEDAKRLEQDLPSRGVGDIIKYLEFPGQIPDTAFLACLQEAHDDPDASPEALRDSLGRIADRYNLNADKVKLITEWSH